MYQAAILLDFHGAAATAELQLPVERLQTALSMPMSQRNIDVEGARIDEYLLRHLSASLAGGRSFRIDSIDIPHLANIDGAPYVVAHFVLRHPSAQAPICSICIVTPFWTASRRK